jgi:hypothetical protein
METTQRHDDTAFWPQLIVLNCIRKSTIHRQILEGSCNPMVYPHSNPAASSSRHCTLLCSMPTENVAVICIICVLAHCWTESYASQPDKSFRTGFMCLP